MAHIRETYETITPDDAERYAYEELSDALLFPNPRLVAEDGTIVPIPPAAAGTLSIIATLLAAGKAVRVTVSDEAEAARVRYHITLLTQMSEEMGAYDLVEVQGDAAHT